MLAGVSGGADSIALLILLKDASGFLPIHVEAIHVNHGIRGDESDADEAFVRDICRREEVPLHVFRADLNGRRDENTAREARYRFFRECMKRTGADYLVLAHHADDLAETFLMRLLRGAGPEGLGCMRPDEEYDGIRILRPMLGVRKEEIRSGLRTAGIAWREDSSNEDPSFLRNDVRKRLVPLMEEMSRGASQRIAAAARMIASENRVLDAETERFLEAYSGKDWLDYRKLCEYPEGIRPRILRRWWRMNGPLTDERELNARQTMQLVCLACSGGSPVNLPGGMRAERGYKALHLTGKPPVQAAPVPVTTGTNELDCFRLTVSASAGSPGDGRMVQEIPKQLVSDCELRFRRPGDRISPFGMEGTRKLQDYLTDRWIDAPWRDRIPLLCRGDLVLLAGGVGAGGIPRWDPAADNVRLTWSGDMPWAEPHGQ